MVEQIGLQVISARPLPIRNRHTAHLWPSQLFILAVPITAVLPGHSVSIQPVLPFPDLPNFLIAVFVLVVTIRSRRVVDIVPVLSNCMFFTVLFTLLSPTPLSLLSTTIEAIDIIIISRGRPVSQRTFGLWPCDIGRLVSECRIRPGKCGLWLGLLTCQLGPFRGLKS